MSSCKEDQEDEKEVLLSIYESDDCFKSIDEQTYQYRVGEAGHINSFLLEIKWGDSYPEVLPAINLELFYNKHLCSKVKKSLKNKIFNEAATLMGCAMTYSLFEYSKENAEDLMGDQTEESVTQERITEDKTENKPQQQEKKVKEKKVQLTKAQKRRITERTDFKGERARGWDWVDVVKHLSKTGYGKDS